MFQFKRAQGTDWRFITATKWKYRTACLLEYRSQLKANFTALQQAHKWEQFSVSPPGRAELTESHSNFTAGCDLYRGGGVVVVATSTSLTITMNSVYLYIRVCMAEGLACSYGSWMGPMLHLPSLNQLYMWKGVKALSSIFLGVMIQISRSHSDITLSKLDWLTMRH